MPRGLKRDHKNAMAKRSDALARRELSYPTDPRQAPASPTSMAIKTVDAATRALIDDALKGRKV